MSQLSYIIAETVAAHPDCCSVAQLCRASPLARASYYRYRSAGNTDIPATDIPREMDETTMRDTIQQIALELPSYGYRRITKELQRRGITINHKRVLRLMREDNLLCLRKKRFIATTDSEHGHPVHPNLAAALTVTGLDQLWVADLTYIRLPAEFVYLAVILDAYSRRVIGWELNWHLDARLTITYNSPATGTVQPHRLDRFGASFRSWSAVCLF